MAYTLSDLDAMTIQEAQALPLAERDQLLDLILADGRRQSTEAVSHRIGLYCDYFEEDLTRMLKVRAVKVLCRGTTASGFDGVIIGQTDADQYRATLSHVQTTLEAAGTNFGRVVTLVVFLTNMENWPLFNEIYREFVPNPPCRAVIGTTGLAEKPLSIEIVECIAYKVIP
jgi:2-iminobutanoate/2-iminopropanoate deaminase